jgi:predicted AlkP superfamily pyrophosphatase or phosphodiesterase
VEIMRFFTLCASLTLALAAARAAEVKTVVIFAVDGLGANVLRADTPPHFAEFIKNGSYSLHARGVMPTVTFPNFASMISGAGPEQHGVTSNDWRPDKFTIAPQCAGNDGHFPTIFGLLKAARPAAKSAMFFDGGGFPFIAEVGLPDKIGTAKGPDATFDIAVDYLTTEHPALLFLHVDLLDHAGHTEGWESPTYAAEFQHTDELLGKLMARLKEAKMLDSTVVFISADHGGVGKRHGGNSMTEIEIPWLVSGPGIAKGREITAPINTFDTAATIAKIYGLKPPACWIGRSVVEAFGR